MEQYFYIYQYAYDPTRTLLAHVLGYYTDATHKLFFPSTGYSRDEIIKMLRTRVVVFLYDGCYHRMFVKLVKTETGEYLRVDHQNHASDYLG